MSGYTSWRESMILSAATAGVALAAGLWTILDGELLHGPKAMNGSARGTALVLVAVAVPLLLASMQLARRGSAPAAILWASALLYVVYNAVLFLFLTPFNSAFLLYVAMLALGLWSVGALLAGLDGDAFGARFSPQAPVRAVAVYIWVIVTLNAGLWLADIVPSLDDPYPPRMLDGTGVTTNAIYIQDLALWLPLMGVASFWLYRRETRGLVICAAVLGMWVIESISIAVDQWVGHHADPASTVASATMVGPFLALAAIGAVPVWLLLREMATAPKGSHA